jgi:hypothetical protein
MITYQPKVAPLQDAVAKLSDRTPIGSKLKSADWEGVPLALRERAFFAAQVEEANRLQAMKEHLDRAIALVKNPDGTFANRSTFIGDMKKQLAALGYASDPELKGTLQDLTSRARLGLIYDQQIRSAQGYAEWKSGQDEGALAAYPAQELIRVASRRVPRQWHSRWIDAGGPTPDGRLIALKSDPIWSKISRFGVPWPPFDFQSGMGIRDVDRQTAIELGLMAPEDKPVRPELPFNENLQASVRDLDDKERTRLEAIFGDQIKIENGIAKWQVHTISNFLKKARKPTGEGGIVLGTATANTIEKGKELFDFSGYDLYLNADDTRHTFHHHGEGNERDKTQIGLTEADFEHLPDVWRNPDRIVPGNEPGTYKFIKEIGDTFIVITWRTAPAKKKIYLHTFYKKKKKDAKGRLVPEDLGLYVRNGAPSKKEPTTDQPNRQQVNPSTPSEK